MGIKNYDSTVEGLMYRTHRHGSLGREDGTFTSICQNITQVTLLLERFSADFGSRSVHRAAPSRL